MIITVVVIIIIIFIVIVVIIIIIMCVGGNAQVVRSRVDFVRIQPSRLAKPNQHTQDHATLNFLKFCLFVHQSRYLKKNGKRKRSNLWAEATGGEVIVMKVARGHYCGNQLAR